MLRHCVLAVCTWACATAWAVVDVNRAPAEDLNTFKGIGPQTSARIVQARNERPFRDWQDLIQRIKGLGPSTAERLSSQGLTVNGQRFSPTAPQVPSATRTHVPVR